MVQQVFEKFELTGRQIDFLAIPFDLARNDIQFEVRISELQRLLGSPAPRQCPYSGEKLGKRKGLNQVIVGPSVESLYSILNRVTSRQDENWRPQASLP